jgi:hypothetical protein
MCQGIMRPARTGRDEALAGTSGRGGCPMVIPQYGTAIIKFGSGENQQASGRGAEISA